MEEQNTPTPLQTTKEQLQQCQQSKEIQSCLKCESVLKCELRQAYVNAVYRTLNQDGGSFEF